MADNPVDSSLEAANQTLYINNLNDRLSKTFLRHQLYVLGTAYGQILDVVALKTDKMRGQAFLVFKELEDALRAQSDLNGLMFFGKPMQVAFARSRSKRAVDFEAHVIQPARERARMAKIFRQR